MYVCYLYLLCAICILRRVHTAVVFMYLQGWQLLVQKLNDLRDKDVT
jgi:hypothetical protein